MQPYDQDYAAVSRRNLDHAREHGSDCGDPDCEIHSPWQIEDERERYTAIAWYIAGAKTAASDMEELLQGHLEEKYDVLQEMAEGSDDVP
jgi:hypothetical protein